ncbi:hypothetical protein GUJ93_ZPchr0006g43531 [Zizania palustris]|uniref:Uncharacterized protein n=1 Tax=Zizania palustris TaxID=103762 RepID=A0A8J5T2B1_ZIZPA|nr:hypothetical protein GUJ93_ZPchr0006g46336 [Zizania palustris]KAG8077159.1 hypothetical protein GUJ93_ZPchr0006g43531 [Zizania palustris]
MAGGSGPVAACEARGDETRVSIDRSGEAVVTGLMDGRVDSPGRIRVPWVERSSHCQTSSSPTTEEGGDDAWRRSKAVVRRGLRS